MKTRRLSDLYVVGKDVTINDNAVDENGDPLPPAQFWLQKLNSIDSEKATRSANAARSTVLAARRDETSEWYLDALARFEILDKEAVISAIVYDESAKKAMAIEAELEAEEEWSKDNYLEGLRDAWRETLQDRYFADEEDEEAKKVFEEFKRFASLVEERVNQYREDLEADYNVMPLEKLKKKWIEQQLAADADSEWVNEYCRSELFYAVREGEDHKKYYFQNRKEVDELPKEILVVLMAEYRTLIVDAVEGKDSEPTPALSVS
jgi:hypothetical protein